MIIRLNIVYLTNGHFPSRAANAVQTVNMCAAFASLGHTVTLYGRRGAGSPDTVHEQYGVPANAFTIRTFPQRGPRGLHTAAYLWNLRCALGDEQPADLYFARDIFMLASVGRHGAALMYEAHHTLEGRAVAEPLFRWLSGRSNFVRVVAISAWLGEAFRERYSALSADQVLVSHDAAGGPAPHPPAVIGGWAGRPGHQQVGYVGHLYDGRGIETIVAVASRMPDSDFHLVGGMPDDVKRWKRQCSAANVFFHGHRPHAELGGFYCNFDVLLAPYAAKVYSAGGNETSRYMSPLKIFEYMATGKPVICSDLPVLREILEHEENALLVPPACPESWAAALKRLGDDPDLQRRIAGTAREQFLRSHTWEQRARDVLRGVAVEKGR